MSLYGINTGDMWDPHISHQVTSHHITPTIIHHHPKTHIITHMHACTTSTTTCHRKSTLGSSLLITCMPLSTPEKGDSKKPRYGAGRPHTHAGRRPPSPSTSPISFTLSHTHFQTRESCSSLVASFKILASNYHY